MIWEIEYDKTGRFLISYMNVDKQMVKCAGGQSLAMSFMQRILDYVKWERMGVIEKQTAIRARGDTK